jgi:osmotically-inducible protein OsmY
VDASQIGVAVDPATGDLTLFGSVPTREQIRLAENCAVSVRGVTVVLNRLTIRK